MSYSFYVRSIIQDLGILYPILLFLFTVTIAYLIIKWAVQAATKDLYDTIKDSVKQAIKETNK
jgi:hypothetical protein